jgi:alkenylglycerophosphocholine hydrolase
MSIWLILALIFAGLEGLVVWKGWRRVEYIAKPVVILCLFISLFMGTGLQGNAFWFGLGLLFSLAGDMLLLYPHDRLFLAGLVAFLLTHICYLIGFRQQILAPTAWSLILLSIILLNGVRVLRRIAGSMRLKGQDRLVYPVIVYGLVISLMLAAAMSTISDPAWETGTAFLVSAGAFLLWISDLMLAWNRFVFPTKFGNLPIIAAYQLGQILLTAGVIRQFG